MCIHYCPGAATVPLMELLPWLPGPSGIPLPLFPGAAGTFVVAGTVAVVGAEALLPGPPEVPELLPGAVGAVPEEELPGVGDTLLPVLPSLLPGTV